MTIRDTFMDYNYSTTLCNYMSPATLKDTGANVVRPVRTGTRNPSILRGMNDAVRLSIREELYATTTYDA